MGFYDYKLGYIYQVGEMPIKFAKPKLEFKFNYTLIKEDNFNNVYNWLQKENFKKVSFDTETTDLDLDRLELTGFSFSVGEHTFSVIVKHSNSAVCLSNPKIALLVEWIFSKEIIYKWNAHFDLRVMWKTTGDFHNLESNIFKKDILKFDELESHNPIIDVQDLVFIGDSNYKYPSLKVCSELFLGIKQPSFEEAVGQDILNANVDELVYYQSMDAYTTYYLGEIFYPVISKLYNFIMNLNKRLLYALIKFEDTPMIIDEVHLVNSIKQIEEEIEGYKNHLYAEVGLINLNSPKQLVQLLQSKGYDTGVKTASGTMSTGEQALKNLEGVPFVDYILKFRQKTKLLSTYFHCIYDRLSNNLPVRFHYITVNVPTMRFASGSGGAKVKQSLKNRGYHTAMNIQSAPKSKSVMRKLFWDKETMDFEYNEERGQYLVESEDPHQSFRKCFCTPDNDWVWVSADYSAEELMIATNYSGEPVWTEAFKNKEDIHKAVAIKTLKMMGKSEADYNKDERKKSKGANFGLLYEGNEYTLGKTLGMGVEEAKEFIFNYEKALPTLYKWKDQVKRLARRQGYVISHFGVPRRLSHYYRQGIKFMHFADRTAINTLIQGSAGVVMRIVIVKLRSLLKKDKYKDKVQFMSTVHDEVNLIAHKSVLLEFIKDLDNLMRKASHPEWVIQLEPSFSIGRNWGELFKINIADDFSSIEPHSEGDVNQKVEDIVIEEDLTEASFYEEEVFA